MKFILTVVLFYLQINNSFAQNDPATIKSNCQQQENDIDNKMRDLNADWENEKSDLRSGLYCSLCFKTKTELDKTYPGGFYTHIANVHATAVPATQQQMDQAYQNYLSQFNSLKSQLEDKQKSCDADYQNAIQEQNQQAAQAQQDAINAQQEKQREAEANAEKQREAEQLRQQQLQEQLAKQKEELDQNILAEGEKNKQDIDKMMTDQGDKLKNEINSIQMPTDQISFKTSDGTISSSNNIDKVNENSGSLDDFDAASANKQSELPVQAPELQQYSNASKEEPIFNKNDIAGALLTEADARLEAIGKSAETSPLSVSEIADLVKGESQLTVQVGFADIAKAAVKGAGILSGGIAVGLDLKDIYKDYQENAPTTKLFYDGANLILDGALVGGAIVGGTTVGLPFVAAALVTQVATKIYIHYNPLN